MNVKRMMPAVLAAAGVALAGCGGGPGPAAGDNPEGPVAVQLTSNDDVFEANPIYSPDGRWILFESDAAGNRDIWRMPAAGGTAEQLTTHPGFDSSPYWSPDGSAFVFESDRSGTKNIWILDVAVPGAAPVAVTDGAWDDGSPAWSPDGTRIVYESNRDRRSGTELWVSPAGGGAAVRLTVAPEGVYHRTADWSPDGTEIVFESNRAGGAPALYTMDAVGGELRRITALPGYEGHPAWSPDGRRIAFESTGGGDMQIWVVESTGGEPALLTTAGGYWPRWSPDGAAIVFGAYDVDEPNLWRLDLD